MLDRQPAGDAGVLVYVRVGDAEAILQTIVEAGGEIIVPRTPQDAGIAYATFCDPAGNVLGDLPGRQLAATDRPKHELAGAPLKSRRWRVAR